MKAAVGKLVDALDALGLAGEVAAELQDRQMMDPDALRRELEPVVKEAIRDMWTAGGVARPGAGAVGPAGDRLLTTAEAAQRVGVKEATVRTWCTSGDLPAVKVGRKWRIRPGELDAFLDQRTRGETGPVVDLDAEAARIIRLDFGKG